MIRKYMIDLLEQQKKVFVDVGDTDVDFTQKTVLNSLRTVSDPAASALMSITRRGHRWRPYGADGNRELSCILMHTEHHTHINTDFRVYIELS